MKKLFVIISVSMLTVSAFSDTLMRQIPTTSAFWRTELTNETPLQAAQALGIFGTNFVPQLIVLYSNTPSAIIFTNGLEVMGLGVPGDSIDSLVVGPHVGHSHLTSMILRDGSGPTDLFGFTIFGDGSGNYALSSAVSGATLNFNANGTVSFQGQAGVVQGIDFATASTTATNAPGSISTNSILYNGVNGEFRGATTGSGLTWLAGSLSVNPQTNSTYVVTNSSVPLSFTNTANKFSGAFTGACSGTFTGAVVTTTASIPTNTASMPAVLNPIVANVLYTNAAQRSFLDVNYLLNGTNAGLYFNNLTTTYSEYMTNNMVVGTNAVITDKRSFHYFTVLGPSDVVLFSNLSGCTILSSQRR